MSKTTKKETTITATNKVNINIYKASEVRALRKTSATKEDKSNLKDFFTNLSLCDDKALSTLDKHLINNEFHFEVSESLACTLTLLDSKQHTICKVYDANCVQFTKSFATLESYLQSNKEMCFARQAYKQDFVIRSYFNTLQEFFDTIEFTQKCVVAFQNANKKTTTAVKKEVAKEA